MNMGDTIIGVRTGGRSGDFSMSVRNGGSGGMNIGCSSVLSTETKAGRRSGDFSMWRGIGVESSVEFGADDAGMR